MPNESAKIILAATHGKLTKVRDCLLIEDSINSIQCQFEFRTSDWDNTTKTAVFFRGWATPSTPDEDTIYVMLDESNTCYIPPEVLNKNTLFSVGVFGTSDDYRIVSNWMYYKIKDGCFAEGSSPSGSTPSAYEQLLKQLENHQHNEIYYTKDESEDRFVSQEEINELVATPDWDQPYIDMPGFIKNRTHYEYKDEEYSSDILAEPTVGVHLVKDLSSASQYMLSYYTTDSLNNFKGVYYYKICFEAKLFSKWQNLEKIIWWTNNNAQNIDGANSKIDVNAKKGMYMYVIVDRSLLSSDDAIKFPKLGVYIEVTDAAVVDVMKNILLVQMRVKRLEKRFLPDDTAYLSDVESQIDNALIDSVPDWNQNDESANDYIKNRTHYVKDPIVYEVLNYTNDAPSINNNNGICRIALQKCSFSEIEVGRTYSVTINDITYETVATTTNKIGNDSLGNFGEDSGEIFLVQRISSTLALLYLNISEPPTYISLRITTQFQEVVQLDEKFISYKPGLKINKGDVYSVIQEDGTYVNVSSDGKGEIFNDGCAAPGLNAHAQNTRTTAIGDGSHSEGFETVSKGLHSHTEGELTYAASDNQHVQGKFNIIDTENKYIHIDGNGNYNGSWTDGRSNAHTLDWSGNAWFAGNIKIGGIGQDDEDAKEIATKEYIDNVIDEEVLNAMLEEVLV